MKLLFLLAAWKRPEITEICFMGINRLRKESGFTIDAICVISEQSMISLCKKYNIRYTFFENNPVGAKKNHCLNEAMKLEWDYLVEIGSDDILYNETLKTYSDYFGKFDAFGGKEAIIMDSVTVQCKHIKSDTAYGMGRCLSRKVIEKHCYGVEFFAFEVIMAPGGSMSKDGYGFLRIEQAKELEKLGRGKITGEPRYRLWNESINKGLDNNSNFFLMTQGVSHKAVKLNRPIGIDLKSVENIWPFNPDFGVDYSFEKAIDGLSESEIEAIKELCELSIAR